MTIPRLHIGRVTWIVLLLREVLQVFLLFKTDGAGTATTLGKSLRRSRATENHAELAVEDIGRIDTTEITLWPGVTSPTDRNATNRTSVLQALMATLGSEHVSLIGTVVVPYRRGETERSMKPRAVTSQRPCENTHNSPYQGRRRPRRRHPTLGDYLRSARLRDHRADLNRVLSLL